MSMFSKLFGRRAPDVPPDPFQQSTDSLLDILDSKSQNDDPNTLAQTLIAIYNQDLMMSVAKRLNSEADGEKAPDNYSSSGSMFWRLVHEETDEYKMRRFYWFMSASMLREASDRVVAGEGDPAILRGVWERYFNAAEFLPRIIESNILWSDDEKLLFEKHKASNHREFLKTVITCLTPRQMWSLPVFVELLNNMGFRWGFRGLLEDSWKEEADFRAILDSQAGKNIFPTSSDADSHLFNPDSLTTGARNAPCHCGSGRKFKHCHGALK